MGAGLQVNDMVIAVNGKLTGGMTTVAFDVELATSGSSLILVIARYRYSEHVMKLSERHEQSVHLALDRKSENEKHLGWIDLSGEDVSTGASVSSNHFMDLSDHGEGARVVEESCERPPGSALPTKHTPGLNPATLLFSHGTSNSSNASNTAKVPIDNVSTAAAEESRDTAKERQSPGRGCAVSSSISAESVDDCDEDMNAWLGCVCGENHEKISVFWIQCDSCESWYNVSSKCLGLSESEASKLEEWLCLGCGGEEGGKVALERPLGQAEHTNVESMNGLVRENDSRDKPSGGTKTATPREGRVLEKKNPAVGSSRSKPRFGKGDIVYVQEHAWPTVDNPGGIAAIVVAGVDEDGDALYSIKYIVGGRRHGVYEQYLTPHSF